jgi:hypothetical protein
VYFGGSWRTAIFVLVVVKHSSLRSAFCDEGGRLCCNSSCMGWMLALLSLVGADFVKTTLFLVLGF